MKKGRTLRRAARHSRASFVAAVLLAATTAAARAQFTQYAPPGGALPLPDREVGSQERFDRALQASRWRLGKLYLDPWIGVRDLSLVSHAALFGKSNRTYDLTATAGAGLDGILPLGEHMVWATHVSPRYVWFQEAQERRKVDLDAATGLYGSLGRLGLEASVRRDERLRLFSQELEQQVNTRQDSALLAATMQVQGGFALFAEGSQRRFTALERDLTVRVERLDRDESAAVAGIGYRFHRGIRLQLGAARSRVDFQSGGPALDNRGQGLLLRAGHDTPWIAAGADLTYWTIEPRGADSRFQRFHDLAGSARLQWKLSPRLTPELYGNRNLVYSLDPAAGYFIDSRWGLGVTSRPRERLSLRVFGEQGSNDYQSPAGVSGPRRRDDVLTWGATLEAAIGPLLAGIGAHRSHFDSNLPGLDRDVTVVQSHVTLALSLHRELIWE
ncbi:MAG TPA: hypothetical protein VGV61_19520 [Thermoanaerobaculia bacterium]|jgi:hypothetical protein|nr:hypothetical protein [Thermoanaerobaculia bacterium]